MAKVLVIGSGGREHALCRQFLLSPQVSQVYCAPGNAGMAADGIQLVAATTFAALATLVQQQQIDLTFVGPEIPLQQGIVDYFQARHLPIFGPTQAAAELESSKSFAKALLQEQGIATAAYQEFTDYAAACAYLQQQPLPQVIKANGLAAGKGVTIVKSLAQGQTVLQELLQQHQFKTTSVIIEEFLVGEEFSCMAFVAGDQIVPMPLAQDHKAIGEGDKGANTGSMGAYSPLPQMPADLAKQAFDQVLRPIVTGMQQQRAFNGILYAGLILTAAGIKVIEFNMRFGDPETQVVLPQLTSDFYQLLQDMLAGKEVQPTWQQQRLTLGVVVAAAGYPGAYPQALPLPDLTQLPADLTVYYAGVTAKEPHLVSAGGRVFLIATQAADVRSAQQKIYAALDQLPLADFNYRHDIGWHALA
ncbi:phosphoribosylamine--glycine ligase [Loigolactobacillus binensis]|uniref:Phosphoribosylamine--glycine ligase n=1 Tax=Loigolactobacillus binensis TaxID=2559922 RepID=A0ABW3EB48_9LACO|nr:phosphoribosylamine--glycine ligase [Loigolactobacillus binensis]